MDQYTIDAAEYGDVSQIARFRIALAEETEKVSLDYNVVWSGVMSVIEDDNKGGYLIARDSNDELIGSLLITREWSDRNCNYLWRIKSIYVLPQWRKKGVFKAMYDVVKKLAAEEGVSLIRIYTEISDKVAHSICKSIGMKNKNFMIYEQYIVEEQE